MVYDRDSDDEGARRRNGKKDATDSDASKSASRSRSPSVGRYRVRDVAMSPPPRKAHRRSFSPERSRSPRRTKNSRSRRSRSGSRPRSSSRTRRSRYSPPPKRSRSRSPRRGYGGSEYRHNSRSPSPDGFRLHVADLDVDVRKSDMEKLFQKFGEIREVWMARNPPCFAFVVFKEYRDAYRALRETNGMVLGHRQIKVTEARPRVRGATRGGFRGSYDPNMRCYQCGETGHFSRNCTDTKFGYKRPATPPMGRDMAASSSSGGRRARSNERNRYY